MKKLLILAFLTIPLFLFLNTNYASASNSLDIIDDGDIQEYNEDYQNGYRQGYEDGFSHDNRIKIALWEYGNITFDVLDTVYRFKFNGLIQTYGIFSIQDLTKEQIKNKVFIPTFEGYVGSFDIYQWSFGISERQWYLSTTTFYLYVEKPLIEAIMTRDSVDVVQAFKTYLQENEIYGYFERASGLTDYQIGYNTGYNEGFNNAMKETTTKLMSSVLLLIGPILLINITLRMLKKYK